MTAYSDRSYEPAAAPAQPARRLRFEVTRPVDDEAFAAASRHSVWVRRLKVILPALAVLGGVVFWGAMRFVPSNLDAIAESAGIDVTSDSVVMNHPHISGFEGTKRAYEVQAENAVQSLSDPKVVTFNKINATVGLDTAGTAKLDAHTGVYDGNRNTLALKDGIAITTDTGAAATVDQANLDLGAGTLNSSKPIVIKTSEGTVRANAISVTERGKHVVFSGGVSVSYTPSGTILPPPVQP